MNLQLTAKSSDGKGYLVDFLEVEGTLRVFCRCKAGVNRLLCKHVIGLTGLDAAMLHDPGSEPIMRSLVSFPSYTSAHAVLTEMTIRFNEIQTRKDELAAEEKKIRKHFAALLLKPR